jgi:hypothetical protein
MNHISGGTPEPRGIDAVGRNAHPTCTRTFVSFVPFVFNSALTHTPANCGFGAVADGSFLAAAAPVPLP